MVFFRRKKNNKARKILKRIRARKFKNARSVKGVRAICRKVVKSMDETKWTEGTTASSVLNSSGTPYLLAASHVSILPTMAQGVTHKTYLGTKIQQIANKVFVHIECGPGSFTSDSWEYARIIIYKPKLNQNITQAQAYLDSIFANTAFTNIYKQTDPSQVHVIRDTYVMTFNSVWGSRYRNIKYTEGPKVINFQTDNATGVADRGTYVYIILSGENGMQLTYQVHSTIKFKDI